MSICWIREDDHPGVVAYDALVVDGVPTIDVGLEPLAYTSIFDTIVPTHFVDRLEADVRHALLTGHRQHGRHDDDLMWWRLPLKDYEDAHLTVRVLEVIHQLAQRFANSVDSLPSRRWIQGLTISPSILSDTGLVRVALDGSISRRLCTVTRNLSDIDWTAPLPMLHDIMGRMQQRAVHFEPLLDGLPSPPGLHYIHWNANPDTAPSIQIGAHIAAGPPIPNAMNAGEQVLDLESDNIDVLPNLIVVVAAFAWLHGELRHLRMLKP